MEVWDNSQLIMISKMEPFIAKLKTKGKTYRQIKQACLEKFQVPHWLITDDKKRDQAIAGALFAYAMDDEQRQAVIKLKDLTSHILV